jgi:hypothetical protein
VKQLGLYSEMLQNIFWAASARLNVITKTAFLIGGIAAWRLRSCTGTT